MILAPTVSQIRQSAVMALLTFISFNSLFADINPCTGLILPTFDQTVLFTSTSSGAGSAYTNSILCAGSVTGKYDNLRDKRNSQCPNDGHTFYSTRTTLLTKIISPATDTERQVLQCYLEGRFFCCPNDTTDSGTLAGGPVIIGGHHIDSSAVDDPLIFKTRFNSLFNSSTYPDSDPGSFPDLDPAINLDLNPFNNPEVNPYHDFFNGDGLNSEHLFTWGDLLDLPSCSNGIFGFEKNGQCCSLSCGGCGGAGCAHRTGGGSNCCSGQIANNNILCSVTGEAPCTIDNAPPVCSNGLPGVEKNGVCCEKGCGICGGANCAERPGGAAACCTSRIEDEGVLCSTSNRAPCNIDN